MLRIARRRDRVGNRIGSHVVRKASAMSCPPRVLTNWQAELNSPLGTPYGAYPVTARIISLSTGSKTDAGIEDSSGHPIPGL
jgi:hypothetical protein